MRADESDAYRERIVVDPHILVGKPVIKGTRIPVSKILNLIAYGAAIPEIVRDFPVLTEEDVRAALLYASARLDHEALFPLATSTR